MHTIIRSLLAPFTISVFALGLVVAGQSVGAVNPLDNTCSQSNTIKNSEICKDRSSSLFGAGGFWTTLINTMIMIIGAVAVIMIVIGGLRYVLSGGDASAVQSAKNTILYAVIGVVIAIMSYAIVNFVVLKLVP